MSLLDAFPQPVPVRIAGRLRLVSQLQVKHLAQLDGWIAAAGQPDDFDEPEISISERHRRLRAAYDREESASSSPRIDSEEGRQLLFGSVAGLAFFLAIVLREEGIGRIEAAEIATGMTAAEWSVIDQIAFDIDRLDWLEKRIDRELGIEVPTTGASGETLTWAQAVAEMCKEPYGYTPAQVGELYLSQLRVLRTDGDKRERGVERPAGWTRGEFEERVLRKRREFWADSPPLPTVHLANPSAVVAPSDVGTDSDQAPAADAPESP